jgi:hypothetical protein
MQEMITFNRCEFRYEEHYKNNNNAEQIVSFMKKFFKMPRDKLLPSELPLMKIECIFFLQQPPHPERGLTPNQPTCSHVPLPPPPRE